MVGGGKEFDRPPFVPLLNYPTEGIMRWRGRFYGWLAVTGDEIYVLLPGKTAANSEQSL
jgi:hypothetical protein